MMIALYLILFFVGTGGPVYKESLINNNYLDFQQRSKSILQRPNDINNKTAENFVNQNRNDR